MPTIFEKIQEGLANSDLDSQLGDQVANLTNIAATFNQLVQNPPTQIGQLIQNLKNTSLPNTNLFGSLSQTVASVGDLIPKNLDGVTGGLAAGLVDLSKNIAEDITGVLKPQLDAYKSLHALLQFNGSTARGSKSRPVALRQNAAAFSFAARAPASLLASSEFAGAIQKIGEVLNAFPTPFNLENFLQLLHDILKTFPRELFPGRQLPFIDETRQTLETILQWRAADGAQIANHLEATLHATAAFISESFTGVTQPVAAEINTLSGQLDTASLKNLLNESSQGLKDLGTAVAAQNLVTINNTLAALNERTAQLAAVLAGLQVNYFNGQAQRLRRRLEDLPDHLQMQMCTVLSTLNPAPGPNLLEAVAESINGAFEAAQVDEFMAGINTLMDQLRELLAALDLSIIETPIQTAAAAAQSAVDGLDNLLVEVVTQTSLLFDEIDQAVAVVNTAALAEAVNKAITDFQQLLQNHLNNLFAPIRETINSIIGTGGTIDQAAGQFNPEEIIAALRAAIQSLTKILSDPAVVNALNTIKSSLETATGALNALSFKPVNDAVISQIEEVTATLEKIDTSILNFALKLALSATLEVLPGEEQCQALTGTLLKKLDGLLQSGPIPLLNRVKQQPDRLKQQLQSFAPAKLIGDELSKPFQELVGKLEAFQPSKLFDPVQQALNAVKTKLQNQANPGQLLAPLEKPFAGLLQAFDKLQPQPLIAPLQQKIDAMIDVVLDALPVDEFLDIFDAVLQRIQSLVAGLEAVQNLLQKISGMLGELSSPDSQVQAWIDGIVDKLNQVSEAADLQAAFAEIAAAIDGVKAAPLQTAIAPPLETFNQALLTLAPRSLLNQLIRDYRDFPSAAITSLPEPEKQNVQAFFNSFDPLQRNISAPLNDLQEFSESLQAQPQKITDFFAAWNGKFHGPNSPLRQCLPADTSMAGIKILLRETIDQQIGAALAKFLQAVAKIKQLFEAFRAIYAQFVDDVKAKLAVLLNGPGSLGNIRNALNALVDKIRAFNLQFLVDELEALFDSIKGKLTAISPTALRQVVENAFNQTLSVLNVATLLPAAVIAQLDADFAALIAKIKALDPGELVTNVIQPEFEKTLQPFIAAFDLTAFIEALIARMNGLKPELETELNRTCEAFGAMLDAVPSIDLSVSLDIGVDIESPF